MRESLLIHLIINTFKKILTQDKSKNLKCQFLEISMSICMKVL